MSNHLPPSLHHEDTVALEMETPLEPIMSATLTAELQRLPTPRANSDFNRPVLNALTSDQDFDPWWRQLSTRLRWMAVPLLMGLASTFTLGLFLPRLPVQMATVQPIARTPLPTPELPLMPTSLPTTEPRHPERYSPPSNHDQTAMRASFRRLANGSASARSISPQGGSTRGAK